MNVGLEIVSQIIRSSDLQPYLDAGLTLDWLRDPNSDAVFDGADRAAYRRLLEHHAAHDRVMTEALLRKDFPAASYRLPDSDYKASELVELAQREVRQLGVGALVDGLVDAHDGLDPERAFDLAAAFVASAPKSDAEIRPFDWAAWLSGDQEPVRPTLGARDDGVQLLYSGRTHSLVGESEAGKSWLALHWAAQELNAGRRVGYLDFEDGPEGIGSRLVEMLDDLRSFSRFVYVRPEELIRNVGVLVGYFEDCSLIIVDGITEAMEMIPSRPGNVNDWNGNYVFFQTYLLNPLARTGAAVLSIDHPTKSDNGKATKDAGGAGHKRRGMTGASYVLVSKEAFGRGRKGYSAVYVAKDRPGFVRTHGTPDTKISGMVHIADLEIDNRDTGHATQVSLRGPDEFTDFRPTVLMGKVSAWLAGQAEAVSQAVLEKAVPGKATYKRQALDELMKGGYATREKTGKGWAITHVMLFEAEE